MCGGKRNDYVSYSRLIYHLFPHGKNAVIGIYGDALLGGVG